MVGNENQAIGVIQVHGKPTFSLAVGKLVTSARPALGRPEILQARGGSKFRHANPDFLRPPDPMDLLEPRALVEILFKLFVAER